MSPMPERPTLLGAASEQFPILGSHHTLPWALVAEHALQAMQNHGQTLEMLARRGGLTWAELLFVLNNRPYQSISDDEAERRVGNILGIWRRRRQAMLERPQPQR